MTPGTRLGRSFGHPIGLGLAASAATLWGLGGVAAQVLFKRHALDPGWLVTTRMLGGGLILLGVVRPAWPRRQWPWLIIWAVFGMAATQLFWFTAIRYSNVASATFIQYTYVSMTAVWQMGRSEIRPTLIRLVAVAVAVTGVGLLVLGGPAGLGELRLDPLGATFAFASAFTATFMFLGAVPLVRALGPWSTATWGLIAGGLSMLLLAPPWRAHPTGDPLIVAALTAFVVVGGTVLAFTLLFASLRRISATEAAVSSTVEPVVAACAAFALLRVRLLPLQYLGGGLILVAILLLTRGRPFDPELRIDDAETATKATSQHPLGTAGHSRDAPDEACPT